MIHANGQPAGADCDYQDDENYQYDAGGNRTDSGYVVRANNQLLCDGTYYYEYDAEGDRTLRCVWTDSDSDGLVDPGERSQITEYTWDHQGRLVRVTQRESGRVACSHAPAGEHARCSHRVVCSGWQRVSMPKACPTSKHPRRPAVRRITQLAVQSGPLAAFEPRRWASVIINPQGIKFACWSLLYQHRTQRACRVGGADRVWQALRYRSTCRGDGVMQRDVRYFREAPCTSSLSKTTCGVWITTAPFIRVVGQSLVSDYAAGRRSMCTCVRRKDK